MRIISSSEVQSNFESVLDCVVSDSDITIITREDASDVVVMSLSHYNSLMETLHLLRSPENSAHLSRSISQYQATRSNS